jgi:hypothetical protein
MFQCQIFLLIKVQLNFVANERHDKFNQQSYQHFI